MKSFALAALTFALTLTPARGGDNSAPQVGTPGNAPAKAAPDPLQRSSARQASRILQPHQVHDLFQAGDAPRALACLARMLRVDPNDQLAAARLLAAMSQRSFVLPLAKGLHPHEAVHGLDYSDDGQLIATTGEDLSLRLWSAGSGKAVKKPVGLGQGVRLHEWLSPEGYLSISAEHHRTGERFHILRGNLYVTLASGVVDGTFKTEQTTTIPLKAAENAVLIATASNVVTSDSENVISIWESQTGRLKANSPPFGSIVFDALFLPDNSRLVLVLEHGLSIWDSASNTVESQAFPDAEQVEQITLSPDREWLLGWGEDQIALWDTESRKFHGTLRDWSRFPADIPFFGSTGNYVVTTGTGGTVRVWDASTCHPVTPVLTHFDATFKVRAEADLSPDNRWLATVVPDYDETLRIWDVATAKLLNNPIHEPCANVVFAPGGQEFATWRSDSAPRFWQLRAADRAWLPSRFDDAWSYPQACPGGALLGVQRHEDAVPALIDLRTGRVQARISLPLQDVTGAAVCPSGDCFLTVHEDGTVRTWEAASGKLLRVLSGAHLESPRATARYSPEHSILVFDESWGSQYPGVFIWNLTSQPESPRELRYPGGVYDAQFSRDGQRVAIACRDGTVHVCRRASGAPVEPALKHESRVTSVQFSPDGQRLLTTSEGRAHLWDLATAREIFPPRQHEYHFVETHMDQYLKMAARFNPDGKRFATACGFTARVWDAETGTAVLEPLQHPSWVEDVEFSPDGSRLVTTCADRGVRVWDVATGVQIGEPMRVQGEYIFFFSARFSADGQWVVATTPGNGTSPVKWTLWELPRASCPFPESFLDLAEALGGERLDETGMTQPVPWQRLLELREQLTAAPGAGEHGQWARWFFDDQPTRKLTPHSSLTFREYVQQRIQAGNANALREALSLSPTNAAAMMRLAQLLDRELQDTRGRAFWPRQDRTGIAREARFWARRALVFANDDPEVRSACERVVRELSSPDIDPDTANEGEAGRLR